MATASPFPSIDRDNPWPGLAAFTEDLSGFFHGRDKEAEELFRLIRRQLLTVLFGQSGLGKSSLLQAGVFPRLRANDYLPLYLRLNHDPGAEPLAAQVKGALAAAMSAAGVDAPVPGADELLWEYFHRKDIDLWSPKNRLLTPVLAFDQFEEIFTLGRADDARRARGAAFLGELADLVENRPPAALRARFDAGELDPARYNFDKATCQVVLILREDFLPDLESLKTEMRSVLANRMRIRRLTGAQALEIVQKPAPHLLGEGVAERVVEFVAGARGGSAERLLELEVEPALLSVICRELNERRRALGHEQITADLVTGNRREILTDFYERSVADLPAAMREFVEDHLLTKSGFRDNFALETALETPGVTRELIDTLVARRLLRIEEHLGVPRVELAHDVLAEVVRVSRDVRQQRVALREARRHTLQLRAIAAGLAVLLAGASWIAWRAVESRRAEAARASRTDFMVGEQRLVEGKISEGLAYLVRAGRSDPNNSTVGTRLIAELAFRNFALPKGEPLTHPRTIQGAAYSSDGRKFLTRASGVYRIRDTSTGKLIHTLDTGATIAASNWSPDGRRVAFCDSDGAVQIWDFESGKRVIGPITAEKPIKSVRYSPDGRWVWGRAQSCPTAWIWESATGERKAMLQQERQIDVLDFSPESSRILTWSHLGEWRIWRVPDGEPLTAPMISAHAGVLNYTSAFHPGGNLVVIANSRTSMRFHDPVTGEGVGAQIDHELSIMGSSFSGNGKAFATVSMDQTAKLWEVPSGKLLRTFDHDEPLNRVFLDREARQLVTWSDESRTRIWDVASGKLALEPIPVRIWTMLPDLSEGLCVSGNELIRWQQTAGAAAPVYFARTAGRWSLNRWPGLPNAYALYEDRMQDVEVLTGRPAGPPRLFPTRLMVDGYHISPDARRMSYGRNGVEFLWDLRGSEIVRHELGRFGVQGRWFSRDSTRLALREGRNLLHLWDTDTGKRIGEPLKLGDVINSVAFSPDNDQVVVATGGAYVTIWDVATSRQVGEPLREAGIALNSVDISRDGRWIAAGGFFPFTAQVWEANTRKPVGSVLRHRRIIGQVAFTRDGRRLMTSTAWEVQMWDVATGAPLTPPMRQPYEPKDPLGGAVISEDDTWIATWTQKGEVRVWDAATGLLVAGPISFGRPGWSWSFYDSGRFLTAAQSPGGFSVCSIPQSGARARTPDWLLRLGQIVGGGEIDPSSNFRRLPHDSGPLEAIRGELAAAPDGAPFVEWGRWFLADRARRPIAPGMKFSAKEAEDLALAENEAEAVFFHQLLKERGKLAEAESAQRAYLERIQQREGDDSPSVASWRIHLAETLVELGKFAEAEHLARGALRQREKQYPADNYQVVIPRGLLGLALAGQNRSTEAEALLIEVCTRFKEMNANSPFSREYTLERTTACCASLVKLFLASNRPERAAEWMPFVDPESLQRTVLSLKIERHGADSLAAAARHLGLANVLLSKDKFPEAEIQARAGLKIRQARLSAGHLQVAEARLALGFALLGMKRDAEAEAMLTEAWETQKKAFAAGWRDAASKHICREGILALIKLCEDYGRNTKAEEWKKILATLPDPFAPPPAR